MVFRAELNKSSGIGTEHFWLLIDRSTGIDTTTPNLIYILYKFYLYIDMFLLGFKLLMASRAINLINSECELNVLIGNMIIGLAFVLCALPESLSRMTAEKRRAVRGGGGGRRGGNFN